MTDSTQLPSQRAGQGADHPTANSATPDIPILRFPTGTPVDLDSIRLCQNCFWYLRMESGPDKCGHSSALRIDYVRGEHIRFSCDTQRRGIRAEDCGVDANHFEPKDCAP